VNASIGCLVLFLLPFAGTGLFIAGLAVRAALAGEPGQAAFLAMFALVFGGAGIGGILGAFAMRRKLAEVDLLKERHPAAPWLWRKDWASGRIEDAGRVTMWVAWVFAGIWNLIGLPVGFMGVREALEKGNTMALLALLFPLVGFALLVWAARATARHRRYGVSVFEMEAVPAPLGHGLTGVVRTSSPLAVPEGFRVVLSCIRRVTRGSGKNSSTSESILWQEERTVAGRTGRAPEGMTTTVPVAFALPADGQPCDDSNPRDRVLWRLEVSASVPGVDYGSAFEVPVFRTAKTAEPITPEERGRLRDPEVPSEYRQPPESRIRVSTNRRGTEIAFPAARNPGAAAGVSVFFAIWGAAIWFMIHVGAPVLFPIVFGLFQLILLYLVLELWLGVTRVTVDSSAVTVASGYVAPFRERRYAAAEIAEVTTKIGMQAGGRPYYDLTLVRSDGKRVTAASSIRDKREAEWLAGVVKEGLGRQ
jgi:hypothetical protein